MEPPVAPSTTDSTGPAGLASAGRSLIINELSARFEKDHDLIGSQDPYLKLTLSGDEVTTRVIKSGGLNPVWDPEEGYRLHDRGEHPDLLVQAWNKNTLLKDSVLGEGKIAMAELGAGNTHTVPLFDKKGRNAGELTFKAREEQGATGGATSTTSQSGAGQTAAGTAGAAGAAGAAGVAGQQYADDRTATTSKGRHGHDVAQSGAHHHDNARADKTHEKTHDKTRAAPASDTASDNTAYNTSSQSTQGGNTYGTAAAGQQGQYGGQQGTQNLTGTQYSNTGGYDQSGAGGFDNRKLAAGAAAGAVAGAGLGAAAARHNDSESGDIGRAGAHETGASGVTSGAYNTTSGSDIGNAGAYSQGGQHLNQGGSTQGYAPTDVNNPANTGNNTTGGGFVGGVVSGGGGRDAYDSGDISRVGAHETGATGATTTGAGSGHDISNVGAHTHGNQGFNQGSQGYNTSLQGGIGGGSNTTAVTGSNRDVSGNTETITTHDKRTTEDTTDDSSVVHKKSGAAAGGAAWIDPNLKSSDDHWQRSLEAAHEARRQAQIVEATSQETHTKMLAAQEATREFERARREHIAVQDKIAALDLEAKRDRFRQLTEAYEASKGRLGGKTQEVDAAQQEANALRAAVNEKGQALDAEVNETRLHQSHLAEVEAELERLRALAAQAEHAHKEHTTNIDPLRARHTSLTDDIARVQAELAEAQRRKAQLEASEREYDAQLATHHAELTTTETDLAELEEMGRKRLGDAEARRADVDGLQGQLADVQAHLAEHRNRIGVLKQDTEASLASANQADELAARKASELAASQQNVAAREAEIGTAQQALDAAQANAQPLHEKIRKETNTIDRDTQVVEELHRKLGTAKEEVDLAQAKKEELWALAVKHGELADKAADKHFLASHDDHKFVVGNETYNPNAMTNKSSTTSSILQKAGQKLGF